MYVSPTRLVFTISLLTASHMPDNRQSHPQSISFSQSVNAVGWIDIFIHSAVGILHKSEMASQHSSPTDLFTLIENMRNMITTHVPDTIPNQHSSYKFKSTIRIAMLTCLENIENIAREISAPGDMELNNDDTQNAFPSDPALPSSPSSSPIENTYHPALIQRNVEDDAVMNGCGVGKDVEVGQK